MDLITLDEALKKIEDEEAGFYTAEAIKLLAKEIKEIKRTQAEHKLLIEHEERVRTTKAKPTVATPISTKIKVGDRVNYLAQQGKKWVPINPTGTVVATEGNRAQVKWDGGLKQWVSLNRLEHSVVEPEAKNA